MLIILNNKMHLRPNKLKEYISFLEIVKTNNQVIVAPTNCYIPYFKDKIILCGQNVSVMNNGSYTGEVSSEYLKSLGVSYCLVHHFDRIKHFNESINDSIRKINNLQRYNIVPIICITLSNEEEIKDKLFLLDYICDRINMNKEIIISYESLDAIEYNENPSIERIIFVINKIKEYIRIKYNKDIKVLYGGNINYNSYCKYKNISELDGLLIGEKSVDIEELNKIFKED